MTKEQFLTQCCEELSVTHPSMESSLREVLLEQSLRAFFAAAGEDADTAEPDAELLSPIQALAVWRFHRLGSEGISGESFSGVSQQYTAGWPPEVQKAICRRRKVEWQ